ncbi:MAG TPA: RNA-binding cell elongation regulator Jag/EloR [Acidimicrobiales bacterium]|nr:RNA-binding cell elongation regulator Jag/EloR [Acidimicrobiales bacterium]
MEWVETTGKSVDEAKDAALDQLGVDEHDAEFEVVEEPKPGLFGRVRGEARVRARVRPVQARPKAERRRGQRARKGEAAPVTSAVTESPDEADDDTGTGDETAGADESVATDTPTRPARSRRGPRRGATPTTPVPAAETESTDGEEPTMTDTDTLDLDEQAELVREFLAGLVAAFGLEGDLGVHRIDDDTMEVRVDGSDLGLLVGPRGATLQAVSELARTVVQRSASGPLEGRVRVDVAGYRERRREALERFTRQVAEKVLESGTAQVLEPMAAPDRKVVHDTVNTIDGVATESEGEDPNRRVVIVPVD